MSIPRIVDIKIDVRYCHYAKLVRISKRKEKKRKEREGGKETKKCVFNVCGKDKRDNLTCSLYPVH